MISQITANIYPLPKPLKEDALYGLAGDITKTIEPHTEADPVAVHASLLTMYGNCIGRNSYFFAEADKHTCQLYLALVGETSKGRKGISYGQTKRVFESIDDDWLNNRISGGLSSGEGLIWAVRDEVKKGDKVIVDAVNDKRLLVVEKEFVSTLKVAKRPGNTLSSTIRRAWDSGNLNNMTKNDLTKSTGAHISILAHITKEELLRHMGALESTNGFGNRFLWLCVKRSKLLPDGGDLSEQDIFYLRERLAEAINFGKSAGEIKRDSEGRDLWHKVYPKLSEGKPGVVGALMGRSEAQVMRLACIYALLDLSHTIKEVHLKAALAFWDYVEESINYLFGASLGHELAEKIYKFLPKQREDGVNRTDISGYLGRNKSKEEIDAALNLLSSHELIRKETIVTDTGRAVDRFFLNDITKTPNENNSTKLTNVSIS